MSEKAENLVKVMFNYFSDVTDDYITETMWAFEIDKAKNIYKLDSIPFYGPLIATDSEFNAEFDEIEKMLVYKKTTNPSGNSIVLIMITTENLEIETLRNEFKVLNCTSEKANDKYFSMEILHETDYMKIKNILNKYKSEGLIGFAEPCLSSKHQNDINLSKVK